RGDFSPLPASFWAMPTVGPKATPIRTAIRTKPAIVSQCRRCIGALLGPPAPALDRAVVRRPTSAGLIGTGWVADKLRKAPPDWRRASAGARVEVVARADRREGDMRTSAWVVALVVLLAAGADVWANVAVPVYKDDPGYQRARLAAA